MQTPEELNLIWKLIATCSVVMLLLGILAIILLYFIRYNIGKIDGAIDFAQFIGQGGNYDYKNRLYSRFRVYVKRKFPNQDEKFIETKCDDLLKSMQ